MPSNELYLAVLPLIHISAQAGFGLTEETLTLFPDENFATRFAADEVEGYISTFTNRANKYLSGGHIRGYDVQRIPQDDGRVIVKVIQNVG